MDAHEWRPLLHTAFTTLQRAPYGFVVTAGGSEPAARLVQHLHVEPDCSVWFVTSPRSRKASDMRRNPSVCYAVEDRENFAYVSVLGEARVVPEVETRVELWDDGLRAFFPAGPESDDVALVRIESRRVELMSFAASVHPHPYGLSAQVLERGQDGWSTTTSSPAAGALV